MYTKFIIFTLLGATFVSASPLFFDESSNDHGIISDYFHDVVEAIKTHYHNLHGLAKDLGTEIKSQVSDVYNINAEIADKILQKADESIQATLKEYEEVKAKWEARIKGAANQGKEYLQNIQTEANKAINDYAESVKETYNKIKKDVEKAIEEEKLKAQAAPKEQQQQEEHN